MLAHSNLCSHKISI